MSDHTFLSEELASLRKSGMLRSLRDIGSGSASTVRFGDKLALMFCSNNYLGLADDHRLKSAAARAAVEFGTGATGSRLVSGNSQLYAQLENELAEFKSAGAALVFPTGYHANLGAITALVGKDDAIFSDELNHASIIDGARLSRATVHVYRHADARHLELLLAGERSARRKLVVTESIFSMDGDIAPLSEICRSAKVHDALVMVDEAHGTGVFGERGAGLVESLGLASQVDLQMGTFSKALGSLGGYVAGSRDIIDYLLNRARSFIFTTGLPASVLAASLEALRIVKAEPERRNCLSRNVEQLRRGLSEFGFATGPTQSQIIPVILGDERLTMAACRYLLRHGVFAQGIRHPTVALGAARLRLTPMATHTADQIVQVVQAFAKLATLLKSRISREL